MGSKLAKPASGATPASAPASQATGAPQPGTAGTGAPVASQTANTGQGPPASAPSAANQAPAQKWKTPSPGAAMVVPDDKTAMEMDALDGVIDGMFFGVPIMREPKSSPGDKDSMPQSVVSPLPVRRQLPYDPRPAWSKVDGYYTTPFSERSLWGDIPPKGTVMAVDQEAALLLDMADGQLDGRYYDRPIGVYSPHGLCTAPPRFGKSPPQYSLQDTLTRDLSDLTPYSATRLEFPPRPVPPPRIEFQTLSSDFLHPHDMQYGAMPMITQAEYPMPPIYSRY